MFESVMESGKQTLSSSNDMHCMRGLQPLHGIIVYWALVLLGACYLSSCCVCPLHCTKHGCGQTYSAGTSLVPGANPCSELGTSSEDINMLAVGVAQSHSPNHLLPSIASCNTNNPTTPIHLPRSNVANKTCWVQGV